MKAMQPICAIRKRIFVRGQLTDVNLIMDEPLVKLGRNIYNIQHTTTTVSKD
jgi:hypothetical protein